MKDASRRKCYLIHVAGHNLGILMRLLIGAGAPKEAPARGRAFLILVHGENTLAIIIFAANEAGIGIIATAVAATTQSPPPHRQRAGNIALTSLRRLGFKAVEGFGHCAEHRYETSDLILKGRAE